MKKAAAGAVSASAAGRLLMSPVLARAAGAGIPLPSPLQIERGFKRMVGFGPRLTASQAHSNYVDWLEEQFVKAGLQMLPRDNYTTDRWLETSSKLSILEGAGAGPVKIGTYYPRSQATPPGGVTGPLTYCGTAPAPNVNPTDISTLDAAISAYPAEVAAWVRGLTGTLGETRGSILLVDLPLPVALTAAAFLPIATYLSWPGHTAAEFATGDYKRSWIAPGLALPLAPFKELGAAGVVFILDCSYPSLEGSYLPFLQGFEPVPALYVDRGTGAELRARAAGRPRANLTLTATVAPSPTQALTAVLPGESDEVIIFNTHTDGQGFVEENAGVVFAQLARYFAKLPASKRLKRTLVFAAWPGHMVADLPQTKGWIAAHPDLIARAAAALTVEHLGCTEWIDTATGYEPTGNPEVFGVWTTQGKMLELTREATEAHELPRTALLRPPVQFGVGAAFQEAGVPQIGAIAGPWYLLTVSKHGDLDKLDANLAARQIAWLADIATKLDSVPASVLREGDPTLGKPN